jgi:signal transduction histidine kinase
MEVLGAISVPFASAIGNDLVLTVFPDTTRLQKAERQKRAAERQLARAQRMECMGHLAAGVFHDFNTVVHALTLNLDVIREEYPDRHLNVVLKELAEEAQRTSELTRRLLTFCANDQSSFERIDLNRIVINLSKILRRLIGDPHTLQVFSAPEPLWIKGDSIRLEQIIMNLVINARDAMPEGGPISVQCHAVGANIVADDRGNPAPAHIRLMVSDTGCGMDAETVHRVFEPFFTTKGAGGTGLGLSTVRAIVEQHQGWLDVDSRPGRGTTFSIHLPLFENDVAETPIESVKPAASTQLPAVDHSTTKDEPRHLPGIDSNHHRVTVDGISPDSMRRRDDGMAAMRSLRE